MASYKTIQQNKTTVSCPLESITNIAIDDELTKNDLRVFMFLLCRLDGLRYRPIDKKQIAVTLDLRKIEVKESLDRLSISGYIRQGGDEHVASGWKFLI